MNFFSMWRKVKEWDFSRRAKRYLLSKQDIERAKRILILTLAVSLAVPFFSLPVRATTTTTATQTLWLYGDQALLQDAFVDTQNPLVNYGTLSYLKLGHNTTAGQPCYYAGGATYNIGCAMIFQVNLTNIPSANVQLQSVTFWLYMANYAGTGIGLSFGYNCVQMTWNEATITSNAPLFGFSSPLCGSILGGFMVQSRDLGAWVGFSITNFTKDWVNGLLPAGTPNSFTIGYLGAAGSTPYNNFVPSFYSKDAAGGYVDVEPKLQVVYTPDASTVYFSPYCSGGPCELNVFSGSGLAPWLFNWSYSLNGNSTIDLRTGNSAVASTNLKLAYNMDTLNASKMKDFSGKTVAWDGTITGTSVVAGKYGNARSFNGATDVINYGDNRIGALPFTLSLWVYPDATQASASGNIWTKVPNVGFATGEFTARWVKASSKVLFGYNDGAAFRSLTSTGTVPAGQWTHIAATYTVSGGNTVVTIYINGVQDGVPTTLTGQPVAGATPGTFGLDSAGFNGYKGYVDQPEGFSSTLSVSLIRDLATGYPYQRAPISGFNANITQPATLRAADFFGNSLYNTTVTVNANPYFWNVPIPYRLLQVYNQRDAVTTISVTPGSGVPISLDILPRQLWSVPLKSAITYWVNFSLRKADYNTIQSTFSLQRTMANAVSYIVNGTTITQLDLNLTGTNLNVVGTWLATNQTRGLAGATGNLVGGLYQFNLFKPIGPYIPFLGYISVWLLLFFLEVGAAVAWAVAYGPRIKRSGLRLANAEKAVKGLPVRANVLLAVIIILGLFVLITWIFNHSGAQVLIPIPFGP